MSERAQPSGVWDTIKYQSVKALHRVDETATKAGHRIKEQGLKLKDKLAKSADYEAELYPNNERDLVILRLRYTNRIAEKEKERKHQLEEEKLTRRSTPSVGSVDKTGK